MYLYAYCPDLETGFLASPVYRRAKKVCVALPDIYKGHEVHLYGLVCNEDGVWSETAYGGNVEFGMRNEELEDNEELGVRNEELGEPVERAEGAQAGVERNATPVIDGKIEDDILSPPRVDG